jgi:NAD-dependent deacetylase
MVVLETSLADLLNQLIHVLTTARRVVVLTGAGVSAESGIPTFRDSMAGLWKDFDPMTLATPEAFAADPATVTKWYDWRRRGCMAAVPNAGHIALHEMERRLLARGSDFLLSTQNVDRLHQKAGNTRVVELHGSILEWRCTQTGRELIPGPEPFAEYPPKSPWNDERSVMSGSQGAILRPAVVWFGEALPESAIRATAEAAESCDVFLSVGTSAVVYPAAGFIQIAAARGAFTAEINRDETPISRGVDCSIRAKSGEVLPLLVEKAFGAG